MALPTPITAEALAHLLASFEGVRLNRVRNPATGYYLPRTAAVDILARCDWIDADVRAVTSEGVSVCFDGRAELIAWADIRGVRIAALDDMGNRLRATAYAPVKMAEAA